MISRIRLNLFILFFLCSIAPAQLTLAQSFETKFFQSNGIKIHYIDEGQGEPVLLIHGFGLDLMRNWVQPGIVDTLLNHKFRVIAYDARGHGKSSKPHNPEKYGFNNIKDAIHLLDHLSIQRANIVGYSYGGNIANGIRTFYPERCKTVTLGGYGRVGRNLNAVERLPHELVADSLAKGNAGPILRAVIPPDQSLSSSQLKAINQNLFKNNDQYALSAAFRANPGYYISAEELKINKIPTLALIGEQDPMKQTVDAMEKIMTNLTVARIPGAGHNNTLGHPDFTTHLVHFITEYE